MLLPAIDAAPAGVLGLLDGNATLALGDQDGAGDHHEECGDEQEDLEGGHLIRRTGAAKLEAIDDPHDRLGHLGDDAGYNFLYLLVYIVLIYFFAYFWTSVQFQPREMAEQLRDHGSFIPGLRPGPRTADYLERVMERITYVGAGFLAVIAVVPNIVSSGFGIPFFVSSFLGGTGLLIVVSVALDFMQRVEANLLMRNYRGFLGEEGLGTSGIRGPRRP